MSAPTRKGEVGWSVTTTSGLTPAADSSQRTACWSTPSIPAWSLASSAGLMNGTSAPWRRASSAISGLSVETMKRLRSRASRAEATAWPIRLSAPSRRRFLPGRPLEPPRAGIMPKAKAAAVTRLDPHPALLGGRLLCGFDHAQGLESVPAVALGHGRAAHARQEVLGLLDVHVVELAGERVDLPAVGLGIEEPDLVLEPPPLDHARLAHQLKVAVHVPGEEIHMDIAYGARGKAHRE